MRKLLLLQALFLTGAAAAGEGMWTLDNPPVETLRKAIGFAPDEAWMQRAMHGAARIAGGCSSSFVSRDGLVLSNHHCVAECLGELSSAKKDYLKDGFLARQRSEEAACPAMEIDRLERITDITKAVKDATAGLEGTAFKQAQNAVRAKITAECAGKEGSRVRCDVVDLYHGGQYKLYRYHRFQDVRLVFAPEQQMAFFGGDPDNFNFPRYDLDMSIVRVYEDGKPAHVEEFFPLSPSGPAAGDPVFVVGHPGSTRRELTTAQLAAERDIELPARLFRSYELRGIIERYRSEGAESARIANSDLFYIENSLKARRGMFEALVDPALMARKLQRETALRAFVAANPKLKATTAGAWDDVAQALETFRAFRDRWQQVEVGFAFQSDYFDIARRIVRGAAERRKPDAERLPEYNESALPQLQARLFSAAPIYPDYERLKLGFGLTKMREVLGADDPFVHKVLARESPEQMADRLVGGTKLGDLAVRHALWDGGMAAVEKSDDPFIQLALAVDPEARALRNRYESEVEARIQKGTERIAQARFAMEGTGVYPDATFTLRLSYGTVKGWKEGDRDVSPFTDFGGAFDRATGAFPFELAPSWIAARDKIDLARPLNFSSDNDIIGGNSGSPVLNRRGELVGLIFDGNIHSLGGAYWFDDRLNRAVAVDSAAILEAMGKIYGADALRAELLGGKATE